MNGLPAKRAKSVQSVKDDRVALARLLQERETMPVFQVTSSEAVQFARDAVVAAERTTKAECEQRRSMCREREADERTRRTELAQVVVQRAATERAATLDGRIEMIRGRLANASAVGSVNPQAAAMQTIFRLPDSDVGMAIYYQHMAVAVVVDLLIIASLICFEVLGHAERRIFDLIRTCFATQLGDEVNQFIDASRPHRMPTPFESAHCANR